MRLLLAATAASFALMTAASAQTPAATAPAAPAAAPSADDPYLWLEEVEGARALDWVRARNDKSLGVLQADPRFARFQDAALRILEAKDRIPAPGFVNGEIHNFWQDPQQVRGLWRRTTLDSYRTSDPRWETILDVDALSAAEKANWVYRGSNCLPPARTRCLISLSNGGKDAVELREFDVAAKRFTPGGIVLPESKGSAAWLDQNTLLVSRDFGPGSLTASGYPFIVKRMTRGQTLAQATEVFRGKPEDVAAGALPIRDADGALQAVFLFRSPKFFETEYSLLTNKGAVRVPMPNKVSIQDYVDDQLILTLEENWGAFRIGDLVGLDLSDLKRRRPVPSRI
jgi:prolyl oligopeptidase